MNNDKDKITSDGRENLLLRFLGGLALLAVLMMLTAGSCDKKKTDGSGGEGGGQTPGGNQGATCEERGFDLKLAKTSYANAFIAGGFKKDATSGAYNASIEVKLSALTHKNGFVSSHVWINPDPKVFNGYAFQELGTLKPTASQTADMTWAPAVLSTTANTATTDVDGVFCGFGKTVAAQTLKALTADGGNLANTVSPTYKASGAEVGKRFLKRVATDADSILADGENGDDPKDPICLEHSVHGAILEVGAEHDNGKKMYGKLPIGVYGPFNAAPPGTTPISAMASKAYNDKYEENILVTGAYYARDNGATTYTEASEQPTGFAAPTGAENANLNKLMTTATPLVHENNTDALFDEVQTALGSAGVAMASLLDVFPGNMNMGIASAFDKPVTGTGADGKTSFAQPPLGTDAFANAGSHENGGWQKLFTIKPCDSKVMSNGFAVAYSHDTDAAMTTWLKEPKLTYDGTTAMVALPKEAAKKVVVRQGGKAAATGGSSHAMLFESLVSDDATAKDGLGFFTIQHAPTQIGATDTDTTTLDTLELTNNALTTKGVLVCRSALAIQDDTVTTTNKGTVIAGKLFTGAGETKAQLAKYVNTTLGYVDGEIKEDNKGIGMTCYLGLTALWPEAIAGSDKAKRVYATQFKATDETKRKETGKYDITPRYLSLLMVNVPTDVGINNALLAPALLNPFASDPDTATTGARLTIDAAKDNAKTILANIKADTNKTAIKYMTGSVKVSFKQ